MIVGALVVGVTIVPDLARFIRRPGQVVTASGGGYGIASSLVLVLAGLPVLMTGQVGLIDNMFAVGFGVPALVMMIFASWTTNVSNLYSSCLGLSQAIPGFTGKRLTMAAGTLGGLFALSGIMTHLVGFLVFLGVFIPPVAGIYISHFMVRVPRATKSISLVAMLVWVLSAGTSFFLARAQLSLTYVPALDSLLFAMVLYALISKASGAWPRRQPDAGF
jgi:cytosine permease